MATNKKDDMEKISQKENPEYDFELQMKEAMETLEIVFGIKNLSNIELFHLRKITKDVLKRASEDNPGSDLGIIEPKREISQRFLLELYGIDYYYIEKHTETDKDREESLEYIRRTRERAHLI